MSFTKKMLTLLLISIACHLTTTFAFAYGINKKEDFWEDKTSFWHKAYGLHGHDNNGINDYLLDGQSEIDDVLGKFQGKLIVDKGAVFQTLTNCVFGTRGAYGEHLDKKDHRELLAFLFGSDLRHLEADMQHHHFYKLLNHPADLDATGEDDCAVLITPKEPVFLNSTKKVITRPDGSIHFDYEWAVVGRVLQSYLMD